MYKTSLNKSFGKLILLFIVLLCCSTGRAQRIALKTNVLYLATLSPNIGGEIRLFRHFTLDLSVAGNFTSKDKYKLQFQQVAPELRYWFSRSMAQYFIGINTSIVNCNLKFNDTYYDGDAYTVGLTYGFAWVINKRWNIEATVGAGLLKYRCFDYPVGTEKPLSPNKNKSIFAPIKAGVTFSYLLY